MPAEIVKSSDNDSSGGKKKMRLKGVASDPSKDLDGDTLRTDIFDTSYLLERGFVNWHHQSKTDPTAIIGEPDVAKIRNKDIYIEADLYDTDMGRKAFKAVQDVEKNSKTRRLGWSIEGKAYRQTEKGPISKIVLTGVALTFAPKNSNTFAEIVKAIDSDEIAETVISKSAENRTEFTANNEAIFKMKNGTVFIGEDGKIFYIDKALSAGEGRGFETGENALKEESLESKVKKTKPAIDVELMTKIFNKYPDMDILKAIEVHDLLLNKLI